MRKILLLIIISFSFLSADGKTYYFMSFHLYTNEKDKYEDEGSISSPSIVEINEDDSSVILRLYNDNVETKGWYSFSFIIIDKIYLDNNIIVYIIHNNIGEKSYLYLSPNHVKGLFIDINNFYFNNLHVSCWMQKPIKITD